MLSGYSETRFRLGLTAYSGLSPDSLVEDSLAYPQLQALQVCARLLGPRQHQMASDAGSSSKERAVHSSTTPVNDAQWRTLDTTARQDRRSKPDATRERSCSDRSESATHPGISSRDFRLAVAESPDRATRRSP